MLQLGIDAPGSDIDVSVDQVDPQTANSYYCKQVLARRPRRLFLLRWTPCDVARQATVAQHSNFLHSDLMAGQILYKNELLTGLLDC